MVKRGEESQLCEDALVPSRVQQRTSDETRERSDWNQLIGAAQIHRVNDPNSDHQVLGSYHSHGTED